ncbi:MAG: tetratricopeptide repeat protein [Gammaproteobacteria bacterium]|nr:tetratricopeptide repeat protein [Gammaproteobacteria bacterium]
MSCSSDHDPVDVFNRGDYETAYKLWQPLASRGDLDALNYLGIHYYIGLGVNRDYRKAAGYFRKAAEAGHPDAQYNLGIMYENGQYVSQDFTTAYVWLYAAHMQGNPHAQEHMKRLSGEHKLLPNQITHAQKLSLPYIK